MEIRIGAGGWAYFDIPGDDNLSSYAKGFDFVEVNSTFYEIPDYRVVESWRRKVPKNFEFSIRCHKSISHDYFLEQTPESIDSFNKMLDICRILDSEYLHILSPDKMKFNEDKIDLIKDFFSSFNLKGIRLIWEIRGLDKELNTLLSEFMYDYNIIHCVDISTVNPLVDSDILYTRLFGKGVHNIYQFTDEELKLIDDRIKNSSVKKAIVSFHGVKMYKDAARLKLFQKSGSFPRVTKNFGIRSLEEILKEDAIFPTSKKDLIKNQGWKIIDLTDKIRVRADYYLNKIPEKQFYSIEEIIKTLI